jgi:hypothetical protein
MAQIKLVSWKSGSHCNKKYLKTSQILKNALEKISKRSYPRGSAQFVDAYLT